MNNPTRTDHLNNDSLHQPVKSITNLKELLASWQPLNEDFPEIEKLELPLTGLFDE